MGSIYSILAAQKYGWSYYGTVNDGYGMLSFQYRLGMKTPVPNSLNRLLGTGFRSI
jgi:hypothetical protein